MPLTSLGENNSLAGSTVVRIASANRIAAKAITINPATRIERNQFSRTQKSPLE